MPRVSMNQLTTYRWSFGEDLDQYRAAGFDSVGVWLRKVTDFGELKAIERLADSGLGVSSLGWVGGFTGADATTTSENLAQACDAIGLAAEMDADCLIVHTGGRNGHTRRHATRLLRESLELLLPVAEASGVTLALEPMHPACAGDWTVLHTIEEALDWVGEYDTPALGLAYDTYHFPPSELGVSLPLLARHSAVVHLGVPAGPHGVDQARQPSLGGNELLSRFVSEIVDAGFTGSFDVKLLGADLRKSDYGHVLSEARACVAGWTAAGSSQNTRQAGLSGARG